MSNNEIDYYDGTIDTEYLLLEPYEYMNSTNGKNIRDIIVNIFAKIFNNIDADITTIRNIVNTLHNASLIIDDIEDDSTLRRGVKCSHLIYGTALTINAGYLKMFRILQQYSCNNDVQNIIIDELVNLHIGQGGDIYWNIKSQYPTIAQYIQMIYNKTGSLFRLIIRLCHIMSNTHNLCEHDMDPKYIESCDLLTEFFQIRDDYINLTDVKYWRIKGICEDLDEGKISFLLIHNLHEKLENYEYVETIRKKKNKTKSEKLQCYNILASNGTFEYTYNYLLQLKSRILSIHDFSSLLNYLPISYYSPNISVDYEN